jgi:hypothetical protein
MEVPAMAPRGIRTHVAAGLGLLVLAAPLTFAQSKSDANFYKAYYLENEAGDIDAAYELYRKAAGDRKTSADLRELARRHADALMEDLVSADFTRLVPHDAILYAEMSRPGEQLSMLLDQLGLLGQRGEVSSQRFGISPLLVDGLLGLRGIAVAVTEVNPNGGPPNGVAILHPGDLDVVRGLIDTALPTGGQEVAPIGGFPTWTIEGQVFVTMTQRLLIASPDPTQIEGVVGRMTGQTKGSLADNAALDSVLADRGDGLLTFCVNAQPVMPLIQGMLAQQAAQDPEMAMMMAFMDPSSLRTISGHVGVDEAGINVDLALELAEGHRNLAFNLIRMPHIDRETLEYVPSGAAFFGAFALNPKADVAPILKDSAGQPVVTFMDFGRELFGNLRDVTFYALPSEGGPIPDVACILRVNDEERTNALLDFGLGMANMASGGNAPDVVQIGDVDASLYSLGGMPLHVASDDGRVVLSPSRHAVARAFEASRGDSVFDDPLYASTVDQLIEGRTLAIMANVGRIMKMTGDPQAAQLSGMLSETMVAIAVEHTDTRLSLAARVNNVPDVSGLVAQAIHGGGGHRGPNPMLGLATEAAAPAPEPAMTTLDAMRTLNATGDMAAAISLGEELFLSNFDDPLALNNQAWAMVTEDGLGASYLDLAMRMSERANELTDFENWYYLDTLARVMFESGEVKEAVRLQRLAVKHAQGDPRAGDAEAPLKRYEAALAETVAEAGIR